LHKKWVLGRSVLSKPLRISSFSAVNGHFNAEDAEDAENAEKTNEGFGTFCKAARAVSFLMWAVYLSLYDLASS
jgi:hypothetical protein